MTKTKRYIIILGLIIFGIIINFISYNIINKKVEKEFYDKAQIIANKKVTQFSVDILHHEDTLFAIMENKIFQNYITTGKNIDYIKELFLSISKSHKYIFQIRYLDNTGQEIIRVEKDRQNRSHLLSADKLQNKTNRYYFNEAIKKNKNEIYYSKVDLNIEHGKLEKPIKPTIRLGLTTYDKNEKKGVLIFNIAVKNIFRALRKDTIFNIFIIDKDGEYLYHKKRKYSWSRYLHKNQNILNNIKGLNKNLLQQDTAYFKGYYFQKLYLDNGEGLMIVLRPKQKVKNLKFSGYHNMFLTYITFILLLIILIIFILSTISDQKLKDQLYKSEKMASMGEMIGNIAHQWRQPLSVISTGATGMKMQKQFNTLSDEQFYKTCDTINDNAQYLSKTIDDFRNFIKGDREKKLFNLGEDIKSFLHLVEGSVKRHNISVILDLHNNIQLYGYENELTQCFINIFNNAKDILKEKKIDNKLIFITTEVIDKKVIIKIKDNAGGIPKEILPRIFEPYFTTKHKSQGTGLGLHMTYNLIVNGMHGSVEAINKTYQYNGTEYRGAEFIIKLPIDEGK